jgi:hypothetical protein
VDVDTGPFQFNSRYIYGPDAKLADCSQRTCGAFDCVYSDELLFFCDTGGQFDTALTQHAEMLCNAHHHTDCQICDLVRLDGVGGCPLDESCGTDHALACCQNQKPLCCGGEPGAPSVPYLKDAAGNPEVRLADSPVSISVDDQVGATNAEDARVNYDLSNCDDTGACDITFTMAIALPPNLSLGGKTFSGLVIEGSHPFTGRIDTASGLFVVPAGAMGMYAYFDVDGKAGSIHVTNETEQVVGFASPSSNAFRLTGTATGTFDGSAVSLTISLNGSYENKGPADIAITGASTVECQSQDGARVQLDASSTTDPDGDALHFFWYEGSTRLGTVPVLDTTLSLGSHTIEVSALDGHSRATATTTVTVEDTTPPVLVATADPPCLWPPDHKLVCFEIGDGLDVSVTDACDGQLSAATATISNVQSDDPSTTFDDIQMTSTSVCLRAEAQRGTSRHYTITLTSVDQHGNIGTTDLVVTAPHDNRNQCLKAVAARRLAP